MSYKIEEGYVVKFNNGMYGSFDIQQHQDGYDVFVYLHEKIEEADIFNENELDKFIKQELECELINALIYDSKKYETVSIQDKVKIKRVTVTSVDIIESLNI